MEKNKDLKLYHIPEVRDEPVTISEAQTIASRSIRNLTEPIQMQQGHMQSANFVTGSSGWKLDAAGNLEGNSGTFRGTITATTGAIGGFDIGSDYVRDTANSMGLASTVSGSDDVRFWAGDTFANRATADFRVTEAGAVTASSMTITGGSITSTPIASIPNNSSTDISLLEKTWTMTFSVTDNNTVAWSSGTVTLSNGRTFTISAGNTGNMTALTYIYLDPGASSTVLQTTTAAATALGANKALIGTAQNNTVTASFIPYGPGQPLVDGANIGALSIVAGNIAASTITAGKMSVSQLSAIAADLGSITAGTIVLPSGGFVRSGQTAYATGTGWYIGNDGGTSKFSIGSSTKFVTWDGSTLTVEGTLISDITVFTASDTLQASANTERSQDLSDTTWTKRKEFVVYYPGTVRVKHDTRTNGTGGSQISSQVRINGVSVGALHDNTSSTDVTYTDDVTVTASDLVQVYTKGNGVVATGFINDTRLYYTLGTADPSSVNVD